jgi:nitrate/nitrite transport system substrate-binding protein
MSRLPESKANDPYDADRPLMLRCACGQDHAPDQHASAVALSDDKLEASLMKALFPVDSVRRHFLCAVGAGTARAAIMSVLPLGALQAMAQEKGPLEKKDLKIGFIPITCATPLIMAKPLGFYEKQGLNVEVVKTAGWALIRDKMLNKEYDATHFLSPMPLAISMGVGSNAVPMAVATIQNTNGQAITLANKHKDRRNPKDWKGFRFAVPFDFSMHNYLLRHYLAENGIDPDRDVQIRSVPPPEMVANLRADNIDGFLGPDPFTQRAVFDGIGFLHLLTKELWDGHPCCAFAVPRAMISEAPNTFAALMRSIVEATAYSAKAENRVEVAKAISGQNYLNQPETVVTQVLTGTYADGLGAVKRDANRIGFDPFPWHSMAIWIMTQMRRWGQVNRDLDYAAVASQVFLALDAGKAMAAQGLPVPASPLRTETIMGRSFDPAAPAAWAERNIRGA